VYDVTHADEHGVVPAIVSSSRSRLRQGLDSRAALAPIVFRAGAV
jgi:hypothetical protein